MIIGNLFVIYCHWNYNVTHLKLFSRVFYFVCVICWVNDDQEIFRTLIIHITNANSFTTSLYYRSIKLIIREIKRTFIYIKTSENEVLNWLKTFLPFCKKTHTMKYVSKNRFIILYTCYIVYISDQYYLKHN